MPGDVTLKIDGLREMDRLLKQLEPRVAARVADGALRRGASVIANRAKQILLSRGAVRTGALLTSITVAPPRAKGSVPNRRSYLIGYRQPTSRRAHLTEFGTRHSRAIPHMRPAIDEKWPESLRTMQRVLAGGIEREALKLAGEVGTKRRRG